MHAVKILSIEADVVRIAGHGVVFDAKDLAGEQFAKDCDFKFDWYSHPPVLYDHTFNTPQEPLGRVTEIKTDEYGLWIAAELDRSRAYTQAVLELLGEGVLGFSTGSASHLVRREGNVIKQWPILEVSLTTTPCEPRTIGVGIVSPLHNGNGNGQNTREASLSKLSYEQKGLNTMSNDETVGTMDDMTGQSIGQSSEPNATVEREHTESHHQNGLQNQFKTLEETISSRLEGFEKTFKTFFDAPAIARSGFVLPGDVGAAQKSEQVELALKAWDAYVRRGDRAALKAAMQEGAPSEGGYLVPTTYSDQMVSALRERSILRRAGARVLSVEGTNTFKVPTMSDTSRAVKTAEEGAFSQLEPTFQEVSFTPTKLTRLVKISDELLDDSRIDVMKQILLPDFEQAFAAAENDDFTNGDGVDNPQGITVGASNSGVTTASSTTVTADNIIDIYHALGYLYRQNAVWLMNDSTIQLVRKLRENGTSGNYLWQPGMATGQPDTLLGRPVYTLNTMPELGVPSSRVIVFGDISFFWIIDFGRESMRRLDELYAGTGQVGFRAYRRIDSRVMLNNALVYAEAGI